MEQEAVVIRAMTKRNARTFTLVGIIALVCAMGMFIISKALMGPGMVCFIFGMIFTVLGAAKWLQPEVSIELRPRGLVYHHHRGSIYIEWQNIQRVDIPRSIQSFDSHDLPYIGVRLKSLLPLIDDIPPRLATGLLSDPR